MPVYQDEFYASRLLETILDRAGPIRQQLPDGSWMIQCPAHHDEKPSLHVTQKGDRVLVHCFAGCSYPEIMKAFGIDITKEEMKKIKPVEAQYIYYDEQGRKLFRKLRLFPKEFLIERALPGDEWEPGLGQTRRVIYNLPNVLKASKVYIVEGEKDADNLMKHGLVATTNPNGASERIIDEYVKPLSGKYVVIIPDNDEPGIKHGLDWARKLQGVAAGIKLLKLPDGFKDVSDYLKVHSIDDLLKLEAEAPDFGIQGALDIEVVSRFWTVQITEKKQNLKLVAKGTRFLKNGHIATTISAFRGEHKLPVDGVYFVSSLRTRAELAAKLEAESPTGFWETLLAILHGELRKLRARSEVKEINSHDEPIAPKWLIEPFVLEGVPNILYGPPSSMKSLVALAIAASVKTGIPVIPGTTVHKTGPVLVLDWESAFEVCAARWRKLPHVDNQTIFYRGCNLPLIEELDAIGELIEEKKPAFIIIDSLGPAAGGDLNNPETALSFYYALKQLETPSITIAHAPKNQPTSIYGSVFFSAIPKNIWTIKKLDSSPDESEFIVALTQEKFTTGFLRDPIGIKVRFTKDDSKVSFSPYPLNELYPDLYTNLPLGKRILMVVRSADGITRDEIADVLGVSREAVRKELFRLKRRGLVEERGNQVYPLAPF